MRPASISAILLAVLVGACAAPASAPMSDDASANSASAAEPSAGRSASAAEPSAGRRQVDRGIALFEQGRFAESLRVLQESPEIAADRAPVRAQALKYVAFAQCVTGRQAACRRSFEAVLALDPSFALQPAEVGHPSWGREFERAKAAVGAGRAAR